MHEHYRRMLTHVAGCLYLNKDRGKVLDMSNGRAGPVTGTVSPRSIRINDEFSRCNLSGSSQGAGAYELTDLNFNEKLTLTMDGAKFEGSDSYGNLIKGDIHNAAMGTTIDVYDYESSQTFRYYFE
jgi:hypothetical protein